MFWLVLGVVFIAEGIYILASDREFVWQRRWRESGVRALLFGPESWDSRIGRGLFFLVVGAAALAIRFTT